MKTLLRTAAAIMCVGIATSPLSARQAAPAKPKSAQTRPASTPGPTVPKESGSPENRSTAVAPVPPLAIGELTPVPLATLPAERVEGERATPADIGRLVEWLAYLGAVLYRAGSPETGVIRELNQQLDAARDETGALLMRAREGEGPPAQDYAKVRSNLARLHERIRTLGGAGQ